jgi:serine/threonine protein kinase
LDQVLGGKYAVADEPLAASGMGRVFSGTMHETDSPVAVKVIDRDFAHSYPELVRGLVRERRALISISHTNLAKIIDVVEDNDTIAIVMEMVEGKSLREHLRDAGRLPLAEALSFIRQILSGLSALYGSGFVHGDIKPDNVLLDASAGPAIVKIIDFGLLVAGPWRYGEIFGTPAYMAPELVSPGQLQPAADIYATGIVFYELLAGWPPFEPTQDIFEKHASQLPPPLPRVPNSSASLPSEVWSVIQAMLAKDAPQRPSAFEALAVLERLSPSAAGDVVPRKPSPYVRLPTDGDITAPPSPALMTPLLLPPTPMKDMPTARPARTRADPPAPMPWPPTMYGGPLDPVPRSPVPNPVPPVSQAWPDFATKWGQTLSPTRERRFPATQIAPRNPLIEEAVAHANGMIHRFDAGFGEFLIVDKIDGHETLNWTTSSTPTDFTELVAHYLGDRSDEARVTLSLDGAVDEMGAELGIAIARMGTDSFNRSCDFFRCDIAGLSFAYQVLPGGDGDGDGRTTVLGVSSQRLTIEFALSMIIRTGTDEIATHALGIRPDALPSRLARVMSGLRDEQSELEKEARAGDA